MELQDYNGKKAEIVVLYAGNVVGRWNGRVDLVDGNILVDGGYQATLPINKVEFVGSVIRVNLSKEN